MNTIEIVNGTMCVMDHAGTVSAACVLTRYRNAKRQIQAWTSHFTLDVAVAYRQLANHFSR